MKQALLFTVSVGSMGLLLLLLGGFLLRSDYRTAHGPRVPARIADKYARGGGRSGPDYFLLLNFQLTSGQPRMARLSVTEQRYAAARPGDSLAIRYDPTEPVSVQLADAAWFNPWYLIPLGAGLLGLGLALFGLAAGWRQRRAANG